MACGCNQNNAQARQNVVQSAKAKPLIEQVKRPNRPLRKLFV